MPLCAAAGVQLSLGLVAVRDSWVCRVAALDAELVRARRAARTAAETASGQIVTFVGIEAFVATGTRRNTIICPERKALVAFQVFDAKDPLRSYWFYLYMTVRAAWY